MDEYIQKTIWGQCQYDWFQVVGEYGTSMLNYCLNNVLLRHVFFLLFNTKLKIYQDVLFLKSIINLISLNYIFI